MEAYILKQLAKHVKLMRESQKAYLKYGTPLFLAEAKKHEKVVDELLIELNKQEGRE